MDSDPASAVAWIMFGPMFGACIWQLISHVLPIIDINLGIQIRQLKLVVNDLFSDK